MLDDLISGLFAFALWLTVLTVGPMILYIIGDNIVTSIKNWRNKK
jgi:hypothetical protein